MSHQERQHPLPVIALGSLDFFFPPKNYNLLILVFKLNAVFAEKKINWYVLRISCAVFCLLISFPSGPCDFCIILISESSGCGVEPTVLCLTGDGEDLCCKPAPSLCSSNLVWWSWSQKGQSPSPRVCHKHVALILFSSE